MKALDEKNQGQDIKIKEYQKNFDDIIQECSKKDKEITALHEEIQGQGIKIKEYQKNLDDILQECFVKHKII